MKPLDKILIPVNFSKGATPAVKYAIGLAKAASARLFLLRTDLVHQPHSVNAGAGDIAFATYPPATANQERLATLPTYLSSQG